MAAAFTAPDGFRMRTMMRRPAGAYCSCAWQHANGWGGGAEGGWTTTQAQRWPCAHPCARAGGSAHEPPAATPLAPLSDALLPGTCRLRHSASEHQQQRASKDAWSVSTPHVERAARALHKASAGEPREALAGWVTAAAGENSGPPAVPAARTELTSTRMHVWAQWAHARPWDHPPECRERERHRVAGALVAGATTPTPTLEAPKHLGQSSADGSPGQPTSEEVPPGGA